MPDQPGSEDPLSEPGPSEESLFTGPTTEGLPLDGLSGIQRAHLQLADAVEVGDDQGVRSAVEELAVECSGMGEPFAILMAFASAAMSTALAEDGVSAITLAKETDPALFGEVEQRHVARVLAAATPPPQPQILTSVPAERLAGAAATALAVLYLHLKSAGQ